MATKGGDMAMVPVTRAGAFVAIPTKETAQSVAGFVLVHAAASLIVFLVLEGLNAEQFYQCMDVCPVLSVLEICSIQFPMAKVTMTACCVVQMLAAALALVSTGRPRRAASIVAVCIAVATGMLSIRLVYTALFGSRCCFSGGIVQVASAVVVALGQAAIPIWGGRVSCELAHLP